MSSPQHQARDPDAVADSGAHDTSSNEMSTNASLGEPSPECHDTSKGEVNGGLSRVDACDRLNQPLNESGEVTSRLLIHPQDRI